jgi:acyl-homoserine-lactone acylase
VSKLAQALPFTLCSLLLFLGKLHASPVHGDSVEKERRQRETRDTLIVRDDWGIAHVHGRTDADAVFGMIYAQAEDDFNRVETNYINAMGRLAESEGESAIFRDLRMKLFIQPDYLKAQYTLSPRWLKTLMIAWADGLNLFLSSHPAIRPRVIRRFEPWMALSFSEGSIGGDIERVPLGPLQEFYGGGSSGAPAAALEDRSHEPGGSNGIAIAPENTKNHHALLLINPHTSFFFRSELQESSDEGLNVYGATTWGQFFVYQGFNEHVGWMHTSSAVDNVDFFLETIVRKSGHLYYRYGRQLRQVATSLVEIPYRSQAGAVAVRTFTVYRTHHGPIVQQKDGQWVSVALMRRPVEALCQSFLLTKSHDYASFMKVMQLRANSSNNTVFADSDGDIAYLHPQFIPRRNDRFDYTHPVDGADVSTDWQGLHTLEEIPHMLNPPNGWIMNTNDWPYSAAGPNSPQQGRFPRYMDTAGENPRGIHATLLLNGRRDFTLESLNEAAYDSFLPAFAQLIPALVSAYDKLANTNALKAQLKDQIAVLRGWNFRWSAESIATTLAVLWGDALWEARGIDPHAENLSLYHEMIVGTSDEQKLRTLAAVSDRLQHDIGSWRVPWGRINRFQRSTGELTQHFADTLPSIPVPFTSARWGSLAAFGALRYPETVSYYGTSGNSFVAVVEFGERVSARAVSIGGASADPASDHFNDQSQRYAEGHLRSVYFYPSDLAGHTERAYHPR